MQKTFSEIKQKEKEGKELVGKTKKDCEEKITIARNNLLEKYNNSLASFNKEAGEVFSTKKKEIENELYIKLEKAEKERNRIIEKAKLNFPSAYEFIKEKVYKQFSG
ncbi:MAG: hypothetical protein AB1498_05100 [bacterium]